MPYVRQIVAEKANIINHNKKLYGTFAEIGAGQEVVNYFFKAGLASQTVAKSISAYDMVFSDHIYGKATRYVCEERLSQMLKHEFSLLQNRLNKTKGRHCCFFAFANTSAVSTFIKGKEGRHHSWMGLWFQSSPLQKTHDEILLHVNLLDRTRLQQYEVLGVLGVNLIYTAFYKKKQQPSFITSLVDNFEHNRVEIDVLKCKGPAFKGINHTVLNKTLLQKNLTQCIVFNPGITAPIDAFYEKNIILYSQSISQKRKASLQKEFKNSALFLAVKGGPRNSIKSSTKVICHKYRFWHELASEIRRYTNKQIILYLSMKELYSILNEKTYLNSGVNLMQAMGLLFDGSTQIKAELSSKKPKNKLIPGIGGVFVQKGCIILK